jgi:hypothetical protein
MSIISNKDLRKNLIIQFGFDKVTRDSAQFSTPAWASGETKTVCNAGAKEGGSVFSQSFITSAQAQNAAPRFSFFNFHSHCLFDWLCFSDGLYSDRGPCANQA